MAIPEAAPDQYGVVGHPIAHSWSPFIHGMFAKNSRQNMVYRLHDIEPADFRREVLRLMAQGLTNPQIADALHVSLKTTELHVQHIRGKLGLEARPDSAFWAAQLHWLEP